MDIHDLAIEFNRGYKKEYFKIPQNVSAGYSAWDRNQERGAYPPVKFHKKDPITLIRLRDTDLWLYERDNKFMFQPVQWIKYGFATEQPLALWIEYPKERHFILYKTEGFGITKKFFLVYAEHDGDVYLKWTRDISRATLFRHGPYD